MTYFALTRKSVKRKGEAAMSIFKDRADAGRLLADILLPYMVPDDPVVLGLPRGGVPVAYEVARRLKLPMDVFVVRKLGVPGHEELAMGSIATGNVLVLNREVIAALNISKAALNKVMEQELVELARREKLYRGNRPFPDLKGKTTILVDDGLATGASMLAAARAVRRYHPARVIVAVPVAPPRVSDELEDAVEEFVYVVAPESFLGVGEWYEDFHQVGSDEVQEVLREALAKNT